jgi:hypothetical protein
MPPHENLLNEVSLKSEAIQVWKKVQSWQEDSHGQEVGLE